MVVFREFTDACKETLRSKKDDKNSSIQGPLCELRSDRGGGGPGLLRFYGPAGDTAALSVLQDTGGRMELGMIFLTEEQLVELGDDIRDAVNEIRKEEL